MTPHSRIHANWSLLSRAERDAAYNNSGAVPGSPAIQSAREAASAAFRATHSRKLDIAYGAHERQKWDLFPSAEPTAPCLVFIHGGYWQRGSRAAVSVLAEGVRANGWSVAFPGYRIAPEVRLTDIAADIRAALDWLVVDGPDHGVAGPIVVAGHSAGGHLTALALSHPSVMAGLAISGVFELGPIRDTNLDEKLRLTDEEVASLSPLRLPAVNKPLAIAYGTVELTALVEDSRALHAHRAAAHVPGALLPIPGANHFDIIDLLREPDGFLTRQLLDLLR